MTDCADIQRDLSDVADGLLPPVRHAAVLAHVRTCADCSGVLSDLERLLAAARQLGPIVPPDHIWLEVAGQVHADAVSRRPPMPLPRSRRAVWQWVGLSAALVALTLGAYEVGRERAATPATASFETVNDQLTVALRHYEQAVGELEAAARAGNGEIDPAVEQVLQTNLGAIDAAIAESRAALVRRPDSQPARDSLSDALRRKISVLQATVTLINDLRQADPASATRPAAHSGRPS